MRTLGSAEKTSIKIIKNDVGCRDDTMPKTGIQEGTARRSESMQQSSATPENGLGCGRLLHALTPPRSAFLCLQFLAYGVIPTSYFIFILNMQA